MLFGIGVSETRGIDKNYPTQLVLVPAARGLQSNGLHAEGTRVEGVMDFHPSTIGGVCYFVKDIVYKLQGGMSSGIQEIERNSLCSFPHRFLQ